MEVEVLRESKLKLDFPRRRTLVTNNFERMVHGKGQKEEINPVHGGESHMRPLRKAQISKEGYVQCTWERSKPAHTEGTGKNLTSSTPRRKTVSPK